MQYAVILSLGQDRVDSSQGIQQGHGRVRILGGKMTNIAARPEKFPLSSSP